MSTTEIPFSRFQQICQNGISVIYIGNVNICLFQKGPNCHSVDYTQRETQTESEVFPGHQDAQSNQAHFKPNDAK